MIIHGRNFLLLLLSFFLFCGFFSYCQEKPEILPLKPTYLVACVIVSCILFSVFFKNNFLYIYPKINYWTSFYLIIFLIWSTRSDLHYTLPELKKIFLTIISTYAFVVLLSFDNKNLIYSRIGILLATLINSFNNIYEFLVPEAFFPLDSEVGVIGRSAGFFINPTISGTVLNIGMILSVFIVPRKLRLPFTFLVFIAIVLTFSRAAILGWALIFLYYNYNKTIEIKKTVAFILIFSIIFMFSLPILINYIENTFVGGSDNMMNRVLWFTNPDKHSDHSQTERSMVAMKAWEMFLNRPFLGNGLGSVTHWEYPVSTHNMYLTNIAEYGLLGGLIYPLLIFSTFYGRNRNIRLITIPFALFSLFIGFFSHNLLTDLFFLYACALISLMNFRNKKYNQKNISS